MERPGDRIPTKKQQEILTKDRIDESFQFTEGISPLQFTHAEEGHKCWKCQKVQPKIWQHIKTAACGENINRAQFQKELN